MVDLGLTQILKELW